MRVFSLDSRSASYWNGAVYRRAIGMLRRRQLTAASAATIRVTAHERLTSTARRAIEVFTVERTVESSLLVENYLTCD